MDENKNPMGGNKNPVYENKNPMGGNKNPVNENKNPAVQKLLEAFSQLRKIKWRQSPVVGLKSSEIMVLYCIKKGSKRELSGLKVSEISNALKVAAPTVTQLVNSLDANGYVERTMDENDRRAVRVKLTEKGENAVEKFSQAISDSFNGLVAYLGEEQSYQLAELLSKVFIYFNEVKEHNNSL